MKILSPAKIMSLKNFLACGMDKERRVESFHGWRLIHKTLKVFTTNKFAEKNPIANYIIELY